ncbi:MAG: hypothetical protein D6718_07770 [Acidobacteria bacterium]|nr:MAG: hypothetical protein D6718_07770 [Acidobacteriota bacterium]
MDGSQRRNPLPRGRARLVLAALLVTLAGGGKLFQAPEPEVIYSGTAPGLEPGVTVIRDDAAFDRLVEPLDPDFGGERPDLRKRSVLLVVGRPRENGCRDTALAAVETRNMKAKVTIEERVPEPGCGCGGGARPPAAWLVTVSRLVRKATAETVEAPAECRPAPGAERPVLLWEGSWDHAPGAEIVADEAAYASLAKRSGLEGEPPAVDFHAHRVVAVTGRPRSNGCRRTRVVETELDGDEEAVFTLEEVYPGPGQICTQQFLLPKLFVYRVPAGVVRVRTITRERR